MEYTQACHLVLLHKLEAIKDHILKRQEVVSGQAKGELDFILGLISREEIVPHDWAVTADLVSRNKE